MRNISANLIVIVAYYIAGMAGLLLAIPPGNAAAVWPAAGVALATLIILGKRVLIGIFLGGILVQTASFLDSSNTEKIISSLTIGTIISIGATLQAWLGLLLMQPVLKQDKALLEEYSILKFSLFIIPVSCLCSASIGVATLWINDILTPADLPIAWLTWWIGDAIGVLVFCPVLFALFAEPRSLWQKRIYPVAIPLCIFSVLAFILFKLAYWQEAHNLENEFEKNTIQFTNALNASINLHQGTAEQLKEYFDSSNEVTKEEFSIFVKPKLARYPEIQALEWIPKVQHKDRHGFETRLGTHIKTPGQQGMMQKSPDKPFYFAIEYLEPLSGNENASGFDINQSPLPRAAAEIACKSGNVSVTDAIKLVQQTDGSIAVVFYAPVYIKAAITNDEINCDNLFGFTASVFRLEEAIQNIYKKLPDLKIAISIKNKNGLIYNNAPHPDEIHSIPNQFEFRRVHTNTVANQKWDIIYTPASGFISSYSSWSIWLVIVLGLLISALAGIGLLLLTGRTLRTEKMIQLRTQELHDEFTEKENIASLLEQENKYLEMITRNYSMDDIFEKINNSIEELVPGSISSIMLLDSSGERLNVISAPQLPKDYIDKITGVKIGPDVGSCGTATHLNQQIIVNDISTDPLWKDYREVASEFGLKACWSSPVTVSGDKALGSFALYFTDVTESNPRISDICIRVANIIAITVLRKQSEEQLTFHASHDSLTGLVNRREFERRTERLLSTIRADDNEHALCFLDLDQFKIVNDSCGHTAGDELLRQLTLTLKKVVRRRDTLARLGGDEFGVLMEHCSLDDAHRVATTLLKTIQDYQFSWEERTFKIGVSIGLVPITSASVNLTEILKEADAACYMAKELGRNRIHVYHDEDENLVKRSGEIQWVTRLNTAITENRFCLYAQVIEPLNNDYGQHYELLIRMEDDEGKLIPPGAFLPAAERYNLISKVDHWVIMNALSILKDNPGFLERIDSCSINISGQSLTSSEILDFIIESLNDTKIAPEKICFEITETAAISNLSTALRFITTLKGLGCHFALDDFGSGLSSFAYLKNLPVDYLKIDGMFVKDINDDPIDRAMVKSINDIGHVMNMRTIAEFVENDKIKDRLEQIGVDYAQGYGIGKPVEFIQLVKK